MLSDDHTSCTSSCKWKCSKKIFDKNKPSDIEKMNKCKNFCKNTVIGQKSIVSKLIRMQAKVHIKYLELLALKIKI